MDDDAETTDDLPEDQMEARCRENNPELYARLCAPIDPNRLIVYRD